MKKRELHGIKKVLGALAGAGLGLMIGPFGGIGTAMLFTMDMCRSGNIGSAVMAILFLPISIPAFAVQGIFMGPMKGAVYGGALGICKETLLNLLDVMDYTKEDGLEAFATLDVNQSKLSNHDATPSSYQTLIPLILFSDPKNNFSTSSIVQNRVPVNEAESVRHQASNDVVQIATGNTPQVSLLKMVRDANGIWKSEAPTVQDQEEKMPILDHLSLK